jgi:hypothetical protein
VVDVVSQARRVVGQGLSTAVTPTLGAGGGVSGTAPNVVDVCLAKWLLEEKARAKELLLQSGYDRFYPLLDLVPSTVNVKKYCENREAWREAGAIREIIEIEKSFAYPKILDIIVNAVHDPLGYKEDVELVKRLWREHEREYQMREKLVITKTGKQIFIRREGEKIMVFGDTYPIKDALKQRGFRWDPMYKAWYKHAKDADLEKLINELEVL